MDKDLALIPQEELDEAEAFPETPSSRLTSHILSILLPLTTSKEKAVRYRSTQIISHMVNALDSLDDESYHLIRVGLLKRIRDKEAMVRVQASLGLGRLAGNEDPEEQGNDDSDDDDAAGLLEKLLQVLQNDPSADVRRSLLLNLPLTPVTLPYLLERARDLDPATRRALYSRLLPALGDFRHLSLSMREKLLRWGLRDRDDNVRKATARLFRERWIEDCAGPRPATEDGAPTEAAPPSADALLELLERIDVVNSGVDNGIALEAMNEFWEGRPDYIHSMNFDATFWDNLTSESVFIARSLNDFCRQDGNNRFDSVLEEKMPEVTRLGFVLQRYANTLVEKLRKAASLADDNDDDTVELEFIVEQLLHIAETLDYSDEIGRRKMFALLRETLSVPELPEEITQLVVGVLRLVSGTDSAGEREFCGVVLEAVAEVHDTIAGDDISQIDDDESFHSAKSEVTDTTPTKPKEKKLLNANPEEDEDKAIKEIIVNMKCLHIAQCMLQNVGDNLKENVHLVTMLNNLVVPAVRSHEAPIRERGLLCLGLCCLLDKTLAEENLILFIHCFTKGHPALQVTALHILSDILTTHPTILSPTNATNPEAAAATTTLQKQIYKIFNKGLKATHEPEVQSAATTALSKLMLTRVITDADLLRSLLTTFFSPATRDNAAARQTLSYFIPVYAHSRRENMQAIAEVVPSVIHAVINLGEELEEEEEMVGVAAISGMLVDWTDARKLVILDQAVESWDESGKKEGVKVVNCDTHLEVAEGCLERALGSGCASKFFFLLFLSCQALSMLFAHVILICDTEEEKKTLLILLGKLHISSLFSPEKLKSVLELANEASDAKLPSDATSRNALAKLITALNKFSETDGVLESVEKDIASEESSRLEESRIDESRIEDNDMTVIKGVAEDSVLEELLEDTVTE